ncbi:MAG: Fic family protein [Candidatus Micrarchaeia archaeon]
MQIIYLEKNIVIRINRMVTSRYSQPSVVNAEANLEYYLEAVQHYGENIMDEKERLFKKAAFLLYHLAYNCHAFADGNKRTALISTTIFLNMNSWGVFVSEDKQGEMAKLIKDVAEGSKSVSAVYRWLDSVSKKIESR